MEKERYEYALKIYCTVFRVETDNFDCNPCGVFAALETLTERETLALFYRYNNGYTLREVGETLNISFQRCRQLIHKAINKLRHPVRSYKMSISKCIEKFKNDCDFYKNGYDKALLYIDELKEHNAYLESMLPKAPPFRDLNEKAYFSSIRELGLKVRSYNCLNRAGYRVLGDILKIENLNDIKKIRNLGEQSYKDLINVIVENGFSEWVEYMTEKSELLKNRKTAP